MKPSGHGPETVRLVQLALTDEWQRTQDIAEAVGFSWQPAAPRNRIVREALYNLTVRGLAEQRPQHNGHLWRRRGTGL